MSISTFESQLQELSQLEGVVDIKRWLIENCLWIRNKQGNLVPFKFNEVQDRYWPLRTPRDLILKFRQGGYSTLFEAEFYITALIVGGTNAAIISYEKVATEMLLERVELFDKYLRLKHPEIEWPKMTADSRWMKAFESMDSKLYIGSAEAKVFGAGATITHLHGCLHPDSEILLVDGKRKPIAGVETGEKVYSYKNGSSVKVKNVFSRPFKGKLCKLTFYDNPSTPILLTPEHLVLEKSRGSHWVQADKCKWIGMPIRPINTTRTELPLYKYQAGTYRDFKQDGVIPLDYEFGWLVGLYYAEGSLRAGGLNYALSTKETDYLQRIKKFCDKYDWSVLGTVIKTNGVIKGRQINGETLSVQVNSTPLCSVITSIVGGKDKTMPDWLWDCPREFLDGIIDGYVDGCYGGNKGYEATVSSSRPQLLYQLRALLLSVRHQYSRIGYSPARDSWSLEYPTHASDGTQRNGYKYVKFQSVSLQPYVFVKLRKREWIDYDGLVYDIETKGSFSTPAGIAHNSEMAKWEQSNIENFLAGYEEAVPREDYTRLIYECTPQGEGNVFHQNWLAAKSGNSNFTAHFAPWFSFKENSLPEGSQFALPRDRGKIEPTPQEVDWMTKYSLNIDQIRFWRMVKAQRGELAEQEYPFDDINCFIISGDSTWQEGARIYLKQLLDRCRSPAIEEDGLRVWQLPAAGDRVVIASDVASGRGADFDYAIAINDKFEHMASLRGKWRPSEFAYKLDELGKRYNLCLQSVERNTGWGDTVLDILINKVYYPSLYHSKDYQDMTKIGNTGWYTDKHTKQQMVSATASALEENRLKTYDEILIRELLNYRQFINDRGNVEYRASKGANDDGVDALGQALKVLELTASMGGKRKEAEAYGFMW